MLRVSARKLSAKMFEATQIGNGNANDSSANNNNNKHFSNYKNTSEINSNTHASVSDKRKRKFAKSTHTCTQARLLQFTHTWSQLYCVIAALERWGVGEQTKLMLRIRHSGTVAIILLTSLSVTLLSL